MAALKDIVQLFVGHYTNEIDTIPAEDAVIHLEWKKETSPGGWDSNVPADEIRLIIGMDKERALSILEYLGAEDITGNLAIRGQNGEPPTKLYWALKDYDVVIRVAGSEKVEGLTYWKGKDFGESKLHRAKTEKAVRTIRFNLKIKEVFAEAPKL